MNDSDKEVIAIKLEENFTCIRGLSKKRIRYEVEYGLERGSSVNSYLINPNDNSNTALLIHPPGENYAKQFMEALDESCYKNINKLLIVIGHVNPNRVSLIKRIIKRYPESKLICSAPGSKLLSEVWTAEKPTKDNSESIIVPNPLPEIIQIKEDQTFNFNNEKILNFITAPTARWPGGLIVFDESLGLLMSGKFFGSHLCKKEWSESTPLSTDEDRRYYYDCLISPISNQVNTIISKIEELDIETISPGHGPAITNSWRSLLRNYEIWSESSKSKKLKVALLFTSAYGNTATIGNALSKGINKTGIQVECINCEFSSTSTLIEAIHNSDGYLIGSPTLGGHAPTPIISALGNLLSDGNRKNPIGIFGSYGWSGEAIDLLESKLTDGGFKLGFKPIKVKFKPNAQTLKTIEETGVMYGRKLIKESKRKLKKTRSSLIASKSDPSILALGRIVGSLCILTTQKGHDENKVTGAMVASWVSQASFMPLGLSIAVAKDRAVETLLNKGDMFTLNILGKENAQQIMNKFLKVFEPGQDRLSDINHKFSPGNQPILTDAIAWLECCVKERMECGDHWLIYCLVENGKVLNESDTTAVHHRRTGINY